MYWFWEKVNIKIKHVKDSKDTITKNLGHIYLKQRLASFSFKSLLIDGGITEDWKIIIPEIRPTKNKGKYSNSIQVKILQYMMNC